MRNVLVTGGAGTVGQAVVGKLLERGDRVTVLDGRDFHRPGHRHIRGRTYEPTAVTEALDGCTHAVHLEWSGTFADAEADPIGTSERNTSGSLRLFAACKAADIPCLFASTATYLGDADAPSNEEAPVNRKAFYAIQKSYVENCLTAHARTGLRGASLRIFNVYGSGGRPQQIVNRILHAVRHGEPIRLTGDGGQKRDFVHVEDVATAVLACLDSSRLVGQAINVGTGTGTSLLELVQLSGKIAGRTPEIEFIPAKGEEARYLFADTARAGEEMGWRAQTDLPTGLRKLFDLA